MIALPSEPQTIGKVLDSGFNIFKAGFKDIIILTIMMCILMFVQMVVIPDPIVFPTEPQPGSMPDFEFNAVAFILTIIFSLVYYGIFVSMVIKLAGLVDGQDYSIGTALQGGAKKLPAVIIWYILFAIILMLGFILFFIPGVYLLVALMFGMYAIALENSGPIGAIKRSNELVKGNWWRTTGYATVATLILMVIYFAFIIPAGFMAGILTTLTDNKTIIEIIVSIAYVFATFIVAPLSCALFLAYYKDLVLRKEGGDLAAKIAGA